ncbi:MAG: hypothetical protein K0S14_1416 [Thermomicrobiales bacterium]|nr:hypothetical protein [Thermomicrobiales bacterium]
MRNSLSPNNLSPNNSRGGTRTPDPVINSRLPAAPPFASIRSHNDLQDAARTGANRTGPETGPTFGPTGVDTRVTLVYPPLSAPHWILGWRRRQLGG